MLSAKMISFRAPLLNIIKKHPGSEVDIDVKNKPMIFTSEHLEEAKTVHAVSPWSCGDQVEA